MEKKEINAIYESDIEKFLQSIGILQNIKDGKMKCVFCGELITVENISVIYSENNEIFVCCNKLDCYEKSKSKFK